MVKSDRNAGEGVDRLGGVAHDADLVAPAEPQVEQRALDRADVLELVDDEPLVLPAHLGRDPLVVAEQRGGAQQHVLHVHPALVALDLLVGGEDSGDGGGVGAPDLAPPGRGDALVVVGADVADLGPLDLAGEVAQQRLGDLDAVAPGGQREHRDLGVDQLGRLAAVDLGPEPPDLAQRRGVEGAGLGQAGPHGAQPGAHLPRRARGEGDGQDLGRVVDPRRDAVGDAVGDRAGLAGAGAGEHPDGSPQRAGDRTLLGIQRVQQVLRRRHEMNSLCGALAWGTSLDAREDNP